MNYLKALGVLRLVSASDKGDPTARAFWRGDIFHLQSRFDEEGLNDFFLNSYEPSPILAPWGARSGFFQGSSERAAREALDTILKAEGNRFRKVQDGIRQIRELLRELNLETKAEDEVKTALLYDCRRQLSDEMLQWLDACYVLTTEGRKFPPLFGTGGNEGSGSYVSGFAQQIVACLIERAFDQALPVALFGGIECGVSGGQVPGHFSPRAAGGVNAGQGLTGPSTTNRWDYLLCLEGACLWASGVTRRFGKAGFNVAAFPFTVNVTGSGGPALSGIDSRKPKQAKREVAELWLPLWNRPTGIGEVKSLLSEGRASIGKRSAETGLDLARAACSFGVDRGIAAFERIVFLMRNGQSFMGVSAGRVSTNQKAHVGILAEIDSWMVRFRSACGKKEREDDEKKGAARFTRALRKIERVILDYTRYGNGRDQTRFFQRILIALGAAEQAIAGAPGFREKAKALRPLARLSPEWVAAANDGSDEFSVALALAGIRDGTGKIGPLRTNLEPVAVERDKTTWAEKERAVVWNAADLSANLAAVLGRRVMDGLRAGSDTRPLGSSHRIPLEIVARFLADELDAELVAGLTWGLILCEPPVGATTSTTTKNAEEASPIPRAFALLKLLFLDLPKTQPPGSTLAPALYEKLKLVRPQPEVLALLRSGDVPGACRIASRRLRTVGLLPLPHARNGHAARDDEWSDAVCSPAEARRLSAALLFPLHHRSISELHALTCPPLETQNP